MTGFDYGKSRATADRLLKRYGQAGAIRRTADTGTAWDPTVTTTDHAAIFAVMDYAENMVDGTRILATDKLVYLSAKGLTIEPTPSDVMVIGGAAYAIVNVKPLAPAGVVVLYEIQARR